MAKEIANKETEQEIAQELAVSEYSKALATVSKTSGDPMELLAKLGLSGLHIDFTSFPTIALKNEVFNTQDHPKFGEEVDFIFLRRKETTLYKGQENRDAEPELVYSDDGIKSNTDGTAVAEHIKSWEERGWAWETTEYIMLMVKVVSGPHAGKLCMMQIPPMSRGRFDGYLVELAMEGLNPHKVITKARVGAQIGSGIRAFNPWLFDLAYKTDASVLGDMPE